jgi:hypothetical protein
LLFRSLDTHEGLRPRTFRYSLTRLHGVTTNKTRILKKKIFYTVEVVLQLAKQITEIHLLYEPGYVVGVGNLTEEKSSVSIF